MMSMYLTPKQTSQNKHRFKYSASNDEVYIEDDVTEHERDSYMEPLVNRHIWQLLDRSPILPIRQGDEENKQETMYSSLRISENMAERLQCMSRCLGPKDAVLKKHHIASTTLQKSADMNYTEINVSGDRKVVLDNGKRLIMETNHYDFVEGSRVDETEEEDTDIYDDVIIEHTERLRYTKTPKDGDTFNARICRSRSSELVSSECGCSHQKILTIAPLHSTVDTLATVNDNVKPFTYKLFGEMTLVINEG
ncbi:hypothetical protein DPMN_051208 [Dreissena polymorpha]|uniref:Uncharacterized protein n=1 Tax=Dreissena polymorpha TaxID=45954 RepID=A0A9D4CJD2_DREPO|nr:hypothetical protein DPMN_051208 [Dreissena polymorpha]